MTPPVLDATAGSRMMWFDPADVRAIYVDGRYEPATAGTRTAT